MILSGVQSDHQAGQPYTKALQKRTLDHKQIKKQGNMKQHLMMKAGER